MDRAFTAPVMIEPVSSPYGYNYKLPIYDELVADRAQVVIRTMGSPKLNGFIGYGGGDYSSGFAERADDFLEDVFTRLVEKCESPPFNYTPSTQTLNDNTAVRYREEHVLTSVWNLVQLNALMQATQYNEGMNTLVDDFAGKYRRINDLMVAWRGIRTIPLINQIIDKYCRVMVPWPGGPILATLLDHNDLYWGTSDPSTDWAAAIDLDRGVTSGDVLKLLLDDIEESYEEVSGQSSDTDYRSDYRLITNIMAALGFGTVQIPERRLEVNYPMWAYQQFHELFIFLDTKGVGADTIHGHPVAADADANIHRTFPAEYALDKLDFCGIWPWAVRDTEDETSTSNVVHGMLRHSPEYGTLLHRVYTQEDGWFSTAGTLDLTAADSLQDYIWSMPWVTRHVFGAMAISSEDPEEEYFSYGVGKLKELIMPMDHMYEGLWIALHSADQGYDVPMIH
jgi:hypothetical protein